jgi:alkylation response protein AidB-like acyl-CoA dehydrogenase
VTFLAAERAALEHHLPGLDARLTAMPLSEREARGNPGLAHFRAVCGPRLLVPREYGGLGADPVAAVRIQRAIGARSPSLAVATTMHHFSVATLVELSRVGGGFEWAILQAIAERSWLLSSAFAEGRPGQHILSPTMRARRVEGGLRVSGRKKPCSLTWSMDLISASVSVEGAHGEPARLAVILVPADSPGIERRRFWNSTVLAGAESDEVVLDDVMVPEQMVYVPADRSAADPVQGRGFLWFELLVTASYLGIASGLAEVVLDAVRGSSSERAALCGGLESAMAAVEAVAASLEDTDDSGVADRLARALHVRYAAEDAVARAASTAAALAGGMAFVQSPDVGYLLAASRPLAYHPPSRTAAADALDRHLRGGGLDL